jgi:hypothetical protein
MRLELALTLLLFLSGNVWAQHVPIAQPPSYSPLYDSSDINEVNMIKAVHVRITVDGVDVGANALAKVLIIRELQSKDLVEVVKDDSDLLTVNCRITPTYDSAHIQVGYALSWALTSKLKDLLIDETLVRHNVDKDTLAQVRQSYGGKGDLIDHFVSSCGMDKMGKVIGDDIAFITGTDLIRTVQDQKQLFVK